jgi:hypothetical protein
MSVGPADESELLGGINVIRRAAICHAQKQLFAVTLHHHSLQLHQPLDDNFLAGAADDVAGNEDSIQRLVRLKIGHNRFEAGQVAVDIGHDGQAIGGMHEFILPTNTLLRADICKDPHPALSQLRSRAREQIRIRFFLRFPSAVSNFNLRNGLYTEGYLFEKQIICFVEYYLYSSEDAVPIKCYLSASTDR